jgi:DNA-binding NarL/FixJ family response regulator
LLPAQVQIAIAAGNLEDAIAAADELMATGAEFESESLQAAAVTARGRVQLATKDLGAAAMTLRDAVLRWQALDVPYEVATARTLLGEALRDADKEGAAVEFAAAEELFEHIGARTAATPVTNLPAGLTAREVEVLQLIANGLSNKEIAEALFLSAKTVSRHLSNIFTKIDVNSRAAATAFAFENKLAKAR